MLVGEINGGLVATYHRSRKLLRPPRDVLAEIAVSKGVSGSFETAAIC